MLEPLGRSAFDVTTHQRVVIAGVGETEYTKHRGRSRAELAGRAILAACDDADIGVNDVDALVPYFVGPGAEEVAAMLGLAELRFSAIPHIGGAGSVAAIELAGLALLTGAATYVVAFVARGASGVERRGQPGLMPRPNVRAALEEPHGINTPAQWYSMICRRHMHEFGTTREQLGSVALTMRGNAQLNPHAQMHGRALSMEQYLNAPVIADPYVMFDCCLETEGACAIVLTTAERANPARSVTVRGVATSRASTPDDLFNRPDFFDTGLRRAAPRALHMAGVDIDDLDAAMIYDCFTFEVIQQLEEAGFCPRGEGGPFVADGNIALAGRIPVNPHGGLLSEGHLAGMNHVVEATRQLRGTCGARQIPNVESIGVTGWGDFGDGGFAVLARSQ